MSTIEQRLILIRQAMQRHRLDAYLITGVDPHGSEYPPEHWRSRIWVAGFNGSAGKVVVTADKAGLWTDFRYHEQAAAELADGPVSLHLDGNAEVRTFQQWLASQLLPGQQVGVDGSTISEAEFLSLEENLAPAGISLQGNLLLLQEIWQDERPRLPATPVFEHPVHYAGVSREDKLSHLRNQMRQEGWSYLLVNALDSIAWLLNLRSGDVENLPVALSYLLLGANDCHFFIDQERIPQPLQLQLQQQGISIHPYQEILDFCISLKNETIFASKEGTNHLCYRILAQQNALRGGPDPVARRKACKNDTEICCIRETMVRDGVALAQFQFWLEEELARGEVELTEYSISQRLSQFRQLQPDNLGDSFTAIIGYQANAAKPHYRCKPHEALSIKREGLLLVDSGGQYLGGTTDITRTWSLGEAKASEKRDYTLVLKAHLALACAQFPVGAQGCQLDGLTRQILWRHGLDFQHGTGHGVGFCLSVHEFPPCISSHPRDCKFYAGMVVSNEPGLYRSGCYGIRIENLLLACKNQLFDGFLQFETLSLFPYDRNLINVTLLSREECSWINHYHQRCMELISPRLDPAPRSWLERRCQPLS